MKLKILAIGDIVGRPGRELLKKKLPGFIADKKIDFCIANAENAAGGSGLTPAIAEELLKCGVHVLTTGDHVWRRREIVRAIDKGLPVLRPENCPPGAPGKGNIVTSCENGFEIAVVLLLGRVFMGPNDCPFRAVDQVLRKLGGRTKVVIVDMHAEATSEKIAMGFYLDSRVSAVVGSHTHVQTADDKILSGGTAYITDMGMTGPINSVLGRRTDRVIYHFTTGIPAPFDVAGGPSMLNGVIIDVDQETGKALGIERVYLESDH